MNKMTVKLLAGALFLVLIIMISAGAFYDKVEPGKLDVEAGFAVGPDDPLHAVNQRTIVPLIDVVGTVASEEKINLTPKLPAHVREVHVNAGQQVEKGELLVLLDDREIRQQLSAAQAQLKRAESEYARIKSLYAKQATTEQNLIAAETGYNAARAQVEQVAIMQTYTRIIAPINGVITERRIEVGDLASPGRVLLAIYDPKGMRLEAPVPLRLASTLEIGLDLPVTIESPDLEVTGRITEIVSEIDPLSRTQLVKVHLPGSGILPGSFGRLWLPDAPRQAVLIPESALYRVGQLEMVQVVSDGRARRRLVRSAPAREGMVEILSGLRPGEQVLIKPYRER